MVKQLSGTQQTQEELLTYKQQVGQLEQDNSSKVTLHTLMFNSSRSWDLNLVLPLIQTWARIHKDSKNPLRELLI